ncbi:unnamed protein product [marine sediment metagenome]|uniref:4-alpha-glucanotransferase n=1 Tax=marine sediment metagenome TaxID=412755 RepID=X1HRP5_9ZZZZ
MTSPPTKELLLEKSSNTGRYGGILLHPSSLPGEFGIGDLRPQVYKFIDFLNKYNQNLWQILPLGPTGYGNSPYQCFSAFAGNPMIISPKKLCEIGFLTDRECKPQDPFSESSVDYGKVIPYKWQLLEYAFKKYMQRQPLRLESEFSDFIRKHSF